jgi:hypothetical protein
MAIIETTIITRANTSVSWPVIDTDSNDPYILKTNFTFTKTTTDDQLQSTTVRTWTDKSLFIQDKEYSNGVTTTAWYNVLAIEGLTFSRTLTTTA